MNAFKINILDFLNTEVLSKQVYFRSRGKTSSPLNMMDDSFI